MDTITSTDALEAIYGNPVRAATAKVADRLTPGYRAWVERARFVILSTVGPEGTDASPRGDDGPVVAILDPKTVALPDWRGNDRLDNLRNIVRDPRVSLMFMVPGSNNVIRINGDGAVTADEDLRTRFARNGTLPRTVVLITVREVYFQCARAILRAGLWTGLRAEEAAAKDLPTPGALLAEMSGGEVGGPAYDAGWPARAAKTMW